MSTAQPLVDLNRDLAGGRLWRPLGGWAQRLLALDQVNELYEQHRQGEPGAPAFCRRLLQGLGVETWVEPQGWQRLRTAPGPLCVVANHPLGGREALYLNVLLGEARADYRILSNQAIGRIPEVRSQLFLVNPFGGPQAAQSNRRALRQALSWLGQDGLLGLFPAGEVSTWQAREGRVADGAWASQAARLIRLSGARVLPLHFSGQSTSWIRGLARIHPALKTPWLARELMHGPTRRVEARFGRVLEPSELPAGDDASLAAWLRDRCYELAA